MVLTLLVFLWIILVRLNYFGTILFVGEQLVNKNESVSKYSFPVTNIFLLEDVKWK
jgi:hypothetical protein